MPDAFQPVDVYFSNDPKNNWKSGYKPYKTLTANTPAELEGLLRIGWTLKPPQEPNGNG